MELIGYVHLEKDFESNIQFNLTYFGVTDLAFASSAPPKTQVNRALAGPFGQRTIFSNILDKDGGKTVDWIKIDNQTDADNLLKKFGYFHDGCLHEAHIFTEHFVDSNLAMSCPGHLDTKMKLLIQRQFKDPSAIEMLFEQVTRINIQPTPENYDSIIYGAILLFVGAEVYWSPEEDWDPSSKNRDDYTWISAKKLSWREVDWLGPMYRYDPLEDRNA